MLGFACGVAAQKTTIMALDDSTETQVGLSFGVSKPNEAILPQAGEGSLGGAVEIRSRHNIGRDRKHRVWGKAFYYNGEIDNVSWNEVSDWQLLYPYLAADSIGGDMKTEVYFFDGGYAYRGKRVVAGGELTYNARQDYRQVDPRPRNVVADFNVAAFVGARLGGQALSLEGRLRRYKQTDDIDYFGELGNSMTYHLNGMGEHYYRFKGTNNDIHYRGTGGGCSLSFLPYNDSLDKSGFVAVASYDYLNIEKLLTTLNNLTMSDLKTHSVALSLGYERKDWRVLVNGTFSRKIGTEHMYSDAVNNEYPELFEVDMFFETAKGVNLSYIHRLVMGRLNMKFNANCGYRDIKYSYASPAKEMKTSHLCPVLRVEASAPVVKRLTVTAAVAGFCEYALDKDFYFSSLPENEGLAYLLERERDVLFSSKYGAQCLLRFDVFTGWKGVGVFLEGKGMYVEYSSISAHEFSGVISAGITL